MRAKIRFNNVDEVKQYIVKAMMIGGDILIRHGKYTIDGKSLMGIFSLDLENELDIEFYNLSESDARIIDSLSLIR